MSALLADPRGTRDAPPPSPAEPISFIFRQFSVKILPNNRFLPQTHGLAPPPCSCLHLLMLTCTFHTCLCPLLLPTQYCPLLLLVPFTPTCAIFASLCLHIHRRPYFIISSLCILCQYLDQLLWFLLATLETRFIFARRSRQGVTTLCFDQNCTLLSR